jgi:hypothetical protein
MSTTASSSSPVGDKELWAVLNRIEDFCALVDNATDAIDWVVHERLALEGEVSEYARVHIYSILVLASRVLRESYTQIEKEVAAALDLARRHQG